MTLFYYLKKKMTLVFNRNSFPLVVLYMCLTLNFYVTAKLTAIKFYNFYLLLASESACSEALLFCW